MTARIESEIPYDHQPAGKLILTRDVTMAECHWLERDFVKGETVTRYTGPTHGYIGSGIACSTNGAMPFFEMPRDALLDA